MKGNKPVKVENLKVQIAAVALRLLEDEGPQAVSMRRIAREVGITPMAIYYHYPDRKALLKQITDAEFGKLLVFFEERQKKSRGEEKLLGIMDGYMDYAFARPKVFDYVFSVVREGALQYPQDFRMRKSPTLSPVADAMTDAMTTGVLKEDDPWEMAMDLWSLAHGYLTLYRAGRFALTEKQFRLMVRRGIARLLAGMQLGSDRRD
jgi:AcrR family transcriptional regulator